MILSPRDFQACQSLPTLAEAWKMNFAELAPKIREGMKSGKPPQQLHVLLYLLRRKVARRPRIKKEPSEILFPLKPVRSSWPCLGFKGRNSTLRSKAGRFLESVVTSMESHPREKVSQRLALHQNLVHSSRLKLRDIQDWAESILPQEDVDLFIQWLGECLENLLEHDDQIIRCCEKIEARERILLSNVQHHEKRVAHWRMQLGLKHNILDNIEREVSQYIIDPTRVIQVSWRMLPADESGYRFLSNWFRQRARCSWDHNERLERIEFAKKLSPSCLYQGYSDFEGYIAFVFAWTDSVLLERAENGNAAYIIHRNWANLSKLSKRQLKALPSQLRDVVIHNNPAQWQGEIRMALHKGKSKK